MRVLHVITSLKTGGAEKLMVDLLPRLQSAGLNVDLLLFDGTETPFRKEAESAGIKVYDMGIGGSVYNPMHLLRLIPFLKRYDIVHTHNTAPQFFAAIGSLICNTILVTTEHNTSNRRRNWKWFRHIDLWMYNRYRRTICISDIAETNLRQYLGAGRYNICTINNGVDISKYAYAQVSVELENIAQGSRKLIMVAGFRKQKDQDTLIRSLKYLPDRFHLFLVGDGSRRDELEALIAHENLEERVHLLGIRTNIPQLLHESDYIVMSSHYEGLSLSSIEGMSVGKPFIASDVDGLREVVSGAGVLFTHQDEKAFAEIIMMLDANENNYRSVAHACYERAKQFDISKMTAAYKQCYKKISDIPCK